MCTGQPRQGRPASAAHLRRLNTGTATPAPRQRCCRRKQPSKRATSAGARAPSLACRKGNELGRYAGCANHLAHHRCAPCQLSTMQPRHSASCNYASMGKEGAMRAPAAPPFGSPRLRAPESHRCAGCRTCRCTAGCSAAAAPARGSGRALGSEWAAGLAAAQSICNLPARHIAQRPGPHTVQSTLPPSPPNPPTVHTA